jgi:hypothetical protein
VGREWPLVLSFVVLGCETYGGPTPNVAEAPSVAEPADAAEVLSAARRARGRPRDPPLECVDAPPEERLSDFPAPSPSAAAAKAAYEAVYPQLTACSASLARPGAVRVFVRGADGSTPEEVSVRESSIDDCRVVECVKRAFGAMAFPALEGSTRKATYGIARDIALAPGSAPQTLSQAPWNKGTATNHCVDPPSKTATLGSLPPEQIQTVVRSRSDAFRKCYETGLAHNPGLQGKVSVRFVIDANGNVPQAHIVGNELPDCEVTACLCDEFKKFTFPKPEGGSVNIVYSLVLAPD